MPKKTMILKMTAAALLTLGCGASSAEVLNVEFKFTPYTGSLKEDHVDSVPGKAYVFVNNVPVASQDVGQQTMPVIFDDREVAPSVWVPVASLGPVLRKGKNTLRIEFEPSAGSPYSAQFSWAQVTDQTSESADAGHLQATNQAGEGKEERQGTGKMVFNREFTADFAADQPWHHYPAVTALNEDDKQKLEALLTRRSEMFKPPFAEIYRMLSGQQGSDVAKIRKSKCLDKAYAAGVRISAAAQHAFIATGNPEVVVERGEGQLFEADPKALAKVKSEEVQMCAGMALSVAYPAKLFVVRKPDGSWEAVN